MLLPLLSTLAIAAPYEGRVTVTVPDRTPDVTLIVPRRPLTHHVPAHAPPAVIAGWQELTRIQAQEQAASHAMTAASAACAAAADPRSLDAVLAHASVPTSARRVAARAARRDGGAPADAVRAGCQALQDHGAAERERLTEQRAPVREALLAALAGEHDPWAGLLRAELQVGAAGSAYLRALDAWERAGARHQELPALDVSAAIATLEGLAASDPAPGTLYLLGWCHLQASDPAAAAEAFGALLALPSAGPLAEAAHLHLGEIALDAHQHADTYRHYAAVAASGSDHAHAARYLGAWAARHVDPASGFELLLPLLEANDPTLGRPAVQLAGALLDLSSAGALERLPPTVRHRVLVAAADHEVPEAYRLLVAEHPLDPRASAWRERLAALEAPGGDHAAIHRVVQAHVRQLAACAHQAPDSVSIAWTLQGDGAVGGSRGVDGPPAVAACAAAKVLGWRFPAGLDGLEVRYRIDFEE